MAEEFFVVSPTSKNCLAQACSQGLAINRTPPIQIIVHFRGDSIFHSRLSPAPVFTCLFLGPGAHKAMEGLVRWCEAYANKMPPKLSFLDLSSFKEKRLAIPQEIRQIPFGTRHTCEEIAERTKTHTEEVLIACQENPLPLLIPCHRVLSIHDYPGGEKLYKALTAFEELS
ncbi:methylated-DNA--[protein]-cysteine S-methyltransferase [Chlamydia trachomatis]|uniref:Methylated-DNA protein-cysteine methyltransferase n=1 Tax=Chlamydia trachomatis serovar D (strain ATCC VR-885 / DSM 19411 / UW-3/Cx) TaxID=272561 RepID=O84483_CHLTR|nr:methylated-DNA--[protein]-cysteine S-methyltransferase [Chlamydia trachomatis]NP_219990.1 DNA methyltransferase [Chlamydia trachomatis D/UW-3/CX]AAC68077.1 Methylated-DNA protein - cysteine methyltransferase [Chlamydia trachomatis D/UW-3/CX]ADH19103.1 methylated-DNA protein - cysteine methyltransferase [Chlamydia trachomatis G/11222]ADI51152.1 O6-methylguanine-DNA methyltransferase [Chlamydia trachomatis D-EC]ADI52164.1 O6-methylguanine-DNA methyltransferase [Chlamydia trachomatis D-LC]AGT